MQHHDTRMPQRSFVNVVVIREVIADVIDPLVEGLEGHRIHAAPQRREAGRPFLAAHIQGEIEAAAQRLHHRHGVVRDAAGLRREWAGIQNPRLAHAPASRSVAIT